MTMTSPTSGERRTDAFEYVNLGGELVTGSLWAPGPLARSVWVLPTGAHESADVVVVKHPTARGGPDRPAGTWWEIENDVRDHVTTGMSAADWRDAKAADPTVGRQGELEDVA